MSSKSTFDLSTTAGVLEYLKAFTDFKVDKVVPLSGGNTNFVYRIYLDQEDGTNNKNSRTVVLKHSASYIASDPDRTFVLSAERQNFEVAALKLVKSALPANATVTVPAVLYYDPEAHAAVMDDAGENSVPLKQLLQTHPPSPAVSKAIGEGLGEFLARLHTWGTDPLASQHAFFDNSDLARSIYGWATYGRLVSTLKNEDKLPSLMDPPLNVSLTKLEAIGDLAAERVKTINTANQTLTMGDFWPGNILIDLGAEDNKSLQIHVVDWEIVRPGLPGFDVGQFCAEMHLLTRFNPSSTEAVIHTIDSFMQSYCSGFQVDVGLARTAITHVGAHLVAWTPRVDWKDKELTRKMVEEGIEYLIDGYTASPEWLTNSLVKGLVS